MQSSTAAHEAGGASNGRDVRGGIELWFRWNNPGAAKARGLRNYCAKRAAMSAVARLRKAAEMATAGGSPTDDETEDETEDERRVAGEHHC